MKVTDKMVKAAYDIFWSNPDAGSKNDMREALEATC